MDPILGIHGTALALRGKRMAVLAANLTNTDTPGYKARDLDFGSVLEQQVKGGFSMKSTRAKHVQPGQGAMDASLQYRQPFQPSLDGNTVESEIEMSRVAENAVGYQISLMFASGKIRSLRTAITGGQ